VAVALKNKAISVGWQAISGEAASLPVGNSNKGVDRWEFFEFDTETGALIKA
jgi:hypothetical protein